MLQQDTVQEKHIYCAVEIHAKIKCLIVCKIVIVFALQKCAPRLAIFVSIKRPKCSGVYHENTDAN